MIFKNNRILFVLCMTVAVILTTMLLSWSSNDPSWFHAYSTQQAFQNIFGWYGAHVTSFMFFLLGASAYLVSFLFVFLAFFFLHKKKFAHEWDAFVGCFLLLASISTMSALYQWSPCLPFAAGGCVGQWCAHALVRMCDVRIVQLLCATLLFVSICLVSRFSYIGIARYIVQGLQRVQAYCIWLYPFVKYAGHCAVHALLYLQKKSVRICSFVRSLIVGDFIHDSQIVSFEIDDIIQDALHETAHEQFWVPSEPRYTAAAQEVMPPEVMPEKNKVPEKTIKLVYALPSARLFSKQNNKRESAAEVQSEQELARILEEKLSRFGIEGRVVDIKSGPVITLFEYQPDIDAKISKIIALEDDLALALQAVSIRIIAPMPGRSVVGFEVAKKERKHVLFSALVHAREFQTCSGKLPLILGTDTVGNPVIVDLATMPHLLVAGSTGSGKSVALNTMLMSLLLRKTPEELRLILIDPKRLEFASYADIAHLIFPIVTDPQRAIPVLQWVVATMEERYTTMAACGVKNIFDYELYCNNNVGAQKMPFIVIVIDELSDLMMTAGRDVENLITRIAQMARAAGIHMILATQRPSVDVITGLIKVNFPSRISFRVTSKVDSRTILDCGGAEKLLGKGDMLFMNATSSLLQRVHGAYVCDEEIMNVVRHISTQQKAQYEEISYESHGTMKTLLDGDDLLYKEIKNYIKTVDEISISHLQRRFRIGYNRSARIIEMLEAEGHVLSIDGGKMRKVVR